MYDYTLQQLVLRLAILLLLVAVEGWAIAATAEALGDKGIAHDGRRTLNPLAHLDLLGLATALFFSAGWVKPIAIEERSLRGGRFALLLPVLAGCAAAIGLLLLVLVVRALLLPLLPDTQARTLFALGTVAGPLILAFALANLLPLPPFAGALLLQALSPALARPLRRLHLPAGLAMLALAWLGVFDRLLAPVVQLLLPILRD